MEADLKGGRWKAIFVVLERRLAAAAAEGTRVNRRSRSGGRFLFFFPLFPVFVGVVDNPDSDKVVFLLPSKLFTPTSFTIYKVKYR